MRVLLYCFGTEGDIRPFVALARGLRQRGHEAAVCTSEGYRDIVDSAGVAYLHETNELLRLLRDAMPGMRGARDGVRLLSAMTDAMRVALQDQWAAADTMRPDLVVYHPKSLGGYHIAEKLAVPGVAALALPFFTATREFPIPFIGRWPLRGRANRLSYEFQRFTAVMYGKMINDFRRSTLGLAPIGRFDDLLTAADGRPVPILYGFSRHVRPIPADYPPHVHVTGYWFLDRDPSWQPSPELSAFLAGGEPPLYIGFGSMGFGGGAERRRDAIVAAIHHLGVRAVWAAGWDQSERVGLSDDILAIDQAPHDWLLPRTAAVVHHGGSGTTGAGLRAGKPTLICPFIGDQPFWGHQIHRLGAGPPPLPQWRVTPARLGDSIAHLLGTPRYRATAADIGQRIRAEDGIQAAVDVLIKLQD
jgi:sterol 3beta-glucosyltransferase